MRPGILIDSSSDLLDHLYRFMIDGISRTKYAWLLLFPWLLPAQNASFNLSTATIVVGATAGNASVQLVASPPTAAWTAASNASWLQLAPASASGTGSALVQFSYAANPNTVAQRDRKSTRLNSSHLGISYA